MKGKGRFRLAALLVLAGLGAALAQQASTHTDDGCAVEVHCLTCRTAVGTIAVPAPVPTLPTRAPAAEGVPASERESPAARARIVPESRGPPPTC